MKGAEEALEGESFLSLYKLEQTAVETLRFFKGTSIQVKSSMLLSWYPNMQPKSPYIIIVFVLYQ
jgi:hypothetical protein